MSAAGFARVTEDPRKILSPSAERNKQPILEVLARHAPAAAQKPTIRVVEIASGTGQHAAHCAAALAHAQWQPTEYAGAAGPTQQAQQDLDDIFGSIVAHTEHLPNVAKPVELDAAAAEWPVESDGEPVDILLAINVTHISPVVVTQGIVNGAARLLGPAGKLIIYGPFAERGKQLSEGNAKFDEMLRARQLGWGLREVEWITEQATQAGFAMVEQVEMPANNLTLVYGRAEPAAI